MGSQLGDDVIGSVWVEDEQSDVGADSRRGLSFRVAVLLLVLAAVALTLLALYLTPAILIAIQ